MPYLERCNCFIRNHHLIQAQPKDWPSSPTSSNTSATPQVLTCGGLLLLGQSKQSLTGGCEWHWST